MLILLSGTRGDPGMMFQSKKGLQEKAGQKEEQGCNPLKHYCREKWKPVLSEQKRLQKTEIFMSVAGRVYHSNFYLAFLYLFTFTKQTYVSFDSLDEGRSDQPQ